MKIFFMKKSAVRYIKSNIQTLYINYYREKTNQWIYDLFDYDPFEHFMDVPDFSLATVSEKKGEMDIENCKILYSKLLSISESQASDERLWAGLCNGTFYEYVRRRWNYDNLRQKDVVKDASAILSRFFFSGGIRAGFYRNTLAKCWWVGRGTYQSDKANKFELLDALGPEDFSTKVTDLFYSNTFASNLEIITGICSAWKIFRDKGVKLSVREYLRPTLQYLNVVGGGVLLDIYSSDEIKKMVIDYITLLMSGGQSSIVINSENIENDDSATNDEEEEVIISPELQFLQQAINLKKQNTEEKVESEDISTRLEQILGVPEEVNNGCQVIVHCERNGKDTVYQIPAEKGDRSLYTIEERMLGKGVGFRVFLSGSWYEIKEIHW